MSKTRVNYDEVMRLAEFRSKIESLELKDIEWVRDNGEVINFNEELIEYWRFVGMTNFHFATSVLIDIVNGKESEILKELKGILK